MGDGRWAMLLRCYAMRCPAGFRPSPKLFAATPQVFAAARQVFGAARQVFAPPPTFSRPPLKFLRPPRRFSPLPQAFCGHPSSFCGHPSSLGCCPAGFRPSPNIFAATPQDFAGNPHDLLKACARKLDALHIRDLRALASACCSRFCRKRRERNAYNEPYPPSLASLPLSLEAQSSLLLPFAVALLRVLQQSIESHSCACCIRHNAYNVNTLHGSLHTLTWSVFALPLPIALVLLELQRRHRRLDAQALHLHRIQLRLLSILYASRHAVLLQ